jgi:N-acetylmuramoyl-L-alanine amidase
MKNLLVYFGQVILVSGILYGYYYFFLRNKQFHQYNRFYLLAASLLSLLIPLIRIPLSFNSSKEQAPVLVQLLQTISVTEAGADTTPVAIASKIGASSFSWQQMIYAAYVLVFVLLLIRMLLSLLKIWRMASNYPVEQLNEIRFVKTREPGTPFSFFRWLFWDDTISLQSIRGEQIFRHELFHIRQKHSHDVIFLEVLKTICWINPFFHLIKKEMRVIHEFLADEYALGKEEKWAYAELLLMQALNTQQSLVNPFFHNQIKRRIAMITKPQPTGRRYLRKLLVLPLAILLLGLVAFRYQPATISINEIGTFTVMIDAGHGGEDRGVKSPDDQHQEAALTLDLASTMKKLAPEYGINVILTRESSEALAAVKSDDLRLRMQKVKEINPAVFLSLHVNSMGKPGQYQQSRSGFEAYIASKRVDKAGAIISFCNA